MQPTEETWKPVVGHVGYEVSDQGRVRSFRQRNHPGRILSAPPAGRGYPQVLLDGRNRTVHSLVMEAFVGPRPADLDVAHGNGNRLDNRLENLRYATVAENVQDAIQHGTFRFPPDAGKLTAEQIIEIFGRYHAGGVTLRGLAAEYGVSFGRIGHIVRGVSSSHPRSQPVHRP